jgi:hypothetical protein
MIVDNILDFIGNTPMVQINQLNPNPKKGISDTLDMAARIFLGFFFSLYASS